jgi:heme oxygenase
LIALLQQSARADPRSILDYLEIPDIDLSQNISALLKVGTTRAHVEAENSKGAAALVKGELELQEYIRWLAILWRVYECVDAP